MKKVLISLFSLTLLGSVNAACDNVISFSGAFGGLGAVVSFDKDTILGEVPENPAGGQTVYKKSKTAFGGQIVLGYGHHFDNNMYIALMHESNFLSKANHEQPDENDYVTATFKTSRKVWVPTFGIAAGYIVDDINFGIRGGVSINKFKYEQNIEKKTDNGKYSDTPDEGTPYYATVTDGVASKTLTETSPFIGVYAEKKFGDFIGYINVDYVFKKQKFAHNSSISTKFWNTELIPPNVTDNGTATNRTEHKRPSWKVAVGVKYHLPIF